MPWPGQDPGKADDMGEKVRGNLLLIRHMAGDSIYRVKSNALVALAFGA